MRADELRRSIRGELQQPPRSSFTKLAKDLFWPVSCLGCGKPELLVCDRCLLPLLKPRVRRFVSGGGKLKAIFGVLDYHDPLSRKLVTRFKYEGYTELAQVFTPALTLLIRDQIVGSELVLIPVPGDFWRRLERGYNQTELVAHALRKLTGYPVLKGLRKRQPTPSQTELKRKERRKNLKGKFIWRGGLLKGKTVVIVDDVTTTGATLAEAARVVSRARPAAIFGVVLAFD